jgi:hypothetical protein
VLVVAAVTLLSACTCPGHCASTLRRCCTLGSSMSGFSASACSDSATAAAVAVVVVVVVAVVATVCDGASLLSSLSTCTLHK